MSEFRYWIALIMICLIPGTFAWWFSIHPFIAFWRRLGPARTLAVNFAVAALIAFAVATQRRWLLAVDFGNHVLPATVGAVLLLLALACRHRIGAKLAGATLIGLPELDPTNRPQPLLTTGPYSVVRHPRYLQLLLANWGWALLSNYLATYLLAAASIAAVWIVVGLEEAELSRRYRRQWSDYASRVPRFIPRTRRLR